MQVTSLPVPAVVGMTMCGVCGRVRSWIPSKFSRPPPSVSRMQIPFPVSMTLPPPTLTTQSAPFSRAKAAARFTIAHARVLGHVAPDADAPIPEGLQNPLDQPRLHHPRIGHDERPAAAETGHLHLDVARRRRRRRRFSSDRNRQTTDPDRTPWMPPSWRDIPPFHSSRTTSKIPPESYRRKPVSRNISRLDSVSARNDKQVLQRVSSEAVRPRPARWSRFHRADRSPCSRS